MSRLQSYRARIPTHIIQLMDLASKITLFLVGNNGPLSFIFQDRLNNKYKTAIGAEIKCSCSLNKNDHCIHSLYVFLKIFKISVDNPLIWQCSYTDSELQDLLKGKHIQIKNTNKRHFMEEQNNLLNYLPSDFFHNKQRFLSKTKQINVEKLLLNQDSICPICQQDMTASMCLSHCKVGCGNNYHLECLKVWINHKQNQNSKITCPMCRVQFKQSIVAQLKYQELEFNKKIIQARRKQYSCSGCGLKNIPNLVHKCLFCSQFQLCKSCYDLKKHLKHPFILRKEDGRWQGAQQRRLNQIKIKQFIQNKKQKQQNKVLMQKLRKIQEDPNKLIDFVAAAYPYVSKYISQNIDPYRKLDISQADMKCMKCQSTRMIFLRRLPCGHFIDHQCLKSNIMAKKFYCEKDGSRILKGYQDYLKKQKQLLELKQEAINQQFNPINLQNNYNQRHFARIQLQDNNQTLNNIFQNVLLYPEQANIIKRQQNRVQDKKRINQILNKKKIYQMQLNKLDNQLKCYKKKQSIRSRHIQIQQNQCYQKKQEKSQIRIRSLKHVDNNFKSQSQQIRKAQKKQKFGIQQLIKFRLGN